MNYRGFTYALRPTAEQSAQMDQFAGVCRLVWNLALEQRKNHWQQYQRSTGNNLNYVTQCRELTALRAEFDFVESVSQTAESRALKNLDTAFQRFFKGLGGYPQFKRKGVNDSFSCAGRELVVEKLNRRWGLVKIPKIGRVKFRLTRALQGDLREATISKTAIGWQISFGCLIDAEATDNGLSVGIDRGVTVPLMLSDGTSYSIPAEVEGLERKHRKAQRMVARRKKGSNRRRAAQSRASKIKAKQARVRKHWAHQATTDIACRYGTVVIERLRTKNMTRSAAGTPDVPGKNVAQKRGLNRAILNVGWHQIETMLFYKAARLVKIDPAYTSQACSHCGVVDRRNRENQASFACTSCGHRDNADRNAAINILNRGITPGVEPISVVGVEARTFLAVNPPDDPGRAPGGC